jgi:NADPH:quinone reductase-like Zn-dependent oxidoreductase
MRAVRFHRHGGSEVLRVENTPPPELGAEELLLEVTRAGVTLPAVRLARGGDVPLPHTPGGDVVGRVVARGGNVRGWRIGQRAAALAFTGAYAELAAVNAAFAFPIPDDVGDDAAVALVRGGQVALATLQVSGFLAGGSVLVTAAAGGVGHLTVQLAKALGASRVVAAVGSTAKADFVRSLGADEVVVYEAEWGEPVDVVLDGVGGDVFHRSLEVVKPFGRLVAYNGVGGTVDVNELRMRNKGVIGFSMAQFSTLHRDRYDRNRQRLWEMAATYELLPAVHQILPLDRATEAHRVLESRENLGRVLLAPTA